MDWCLNYEVIFQEEEVERGIENFSFFFFLACTLFSCHFEFLTVLSQWNMSYYL